MKACCCSRYLSSIMILITGLLYANITFAQDFYIAQTAQGGNTGVDCADAYAVTWFNNSGNWSSPTKIKGYIGPGDTVHLCGTISTELYVGANGISGSPITIHFESNAKISTPASNLLQILGGNYITIDGGTNGIMENTANGTNLANQVVTAGIEATGISNFEVKNLTIQNLYVHTSSDTGTQDFTVGGGIHISGGGSNISIHDCTFHDIGWVLNGGIVNGSNYSVYNNYFYNYDHAMAGVGANATNINIYNNHFGSTASWDTVSNQWHHDGIHIFFSQGYTVSNVNIYNNLFDGNWGNNNTAHIFMECDYSHTDPNACKNFTVYNNVHIQYSGDYLNNGFIGLWGPNHRVMNNTYIGSGVYNSVCVQLGGSNLIFQNNIVSGCHTFLTLATGYTLASGGLNYNLYANEGPGGNYPWGNPTGVRTLSAWHASTGQEAHSQLVSSAYLNSNGSLQSSSGARGAGINLTSLSISKLDSDYAGTPRPSSAAWDIGAFCSRNVDPTAPTLY
jgi:hypothetical protein